MAPGYSPLPTQRPTPTPTRFVPSVSQSVPSYPSADMQSGYLQWLQQRGQQQQQQQQQQQSTPDIGSVIDMFGGSSGAGEGINLASGYGVDGGLASSTGADVLGVGQTMPSVGPTIANAQGLSGATAAEAPGAFSMSGVGTAGNAVLPIAGALGAYDLYKNRLKTGNKKRGALQGAASGAAMGSYFGPWGAVAGGVIGAGVGLTAHESTRDGAKRHTQQLMSQNADDPVYQAYVRGMREQYDSAPKDPSKPFAGKYGSWDEYKKSGLEASDLTGVMGNIETFGKDWTKLNFDQQKAVTQGLIDADLYNSKKGEVLVTDQNRAKQIYDSVSQGGFKPAAEAPKGNLKSAAPAGTPAPLMIPRTKTLSPGIGLDGKRISNNTRR